MTRRFRVEHSRPGRKEIVQPDVTVVCVVAGDDDVSKGAAIERGNPRDLRQERLADHKHGCARVAEDELIVHRRPECVEGNRDGAGFDRPEKAVREGRTVHEQQDDPFARPDVQDRSQRAAELIHARQHLCVRDPIVAAFDGDVIAAPGFDVPIDESRRGVENSGDAQIAGREAHGVRSEVAAAREIRRVVRAAGAFVLRDERVLAQRSGSADVSALIALDGGQRLRRLAVLDP